MTVNNVVLVGRITKDPEVRQTAQGVANASFTLAVNRNYKNDQGQREADFINVVIWRKQAELFGQFASKGALIAVTGRIQTRNYENNQGQRVYVTEVVADNFQMLETRGERQAQQQGGSFQPTQQQKQNFFGGQPVEISDDELPF